MVLLSFLASAYLISVGRFISEVQYLGNILLAPIVGGLQYAVSYVV
jgi:hypothetical protein